ncbi:MAG: TonB-dependent receptor, partial [Cetobacterium sp.]|uniref:TonB-dependent receptor n=1 Tax=Cetobacterium sp. TaxID=2071632 RepID=UPI002FC85440
MKSKIYRITAIAIVLSKMSMGEGNFKVKLDETTVTYERYNEISLLDTPKNITIITSGDIIKRGYRNIDEALKMVPGLIYTDGSFSMRGQVPKLADKALVVLLDGVPQNGADNRAYDLDFIPIEKIERIEVVPAGGAIMYGGNATAGVINIITKQKYEKEYWGNVGVEAGSYDFMKYVFNSGFNITKNLVTEIIYSTSDKNGYRNDEKKDLDFFQGSIAYKLDDGNIGFNYEHNKKKATDRISGLTKEQYDENRKSNPDEGRIGKNIQDKYTLNFDKSISNDLKFFTILEYKEREYKYDYPHKG